MNRTHPSKLRGPVLQTPCPHHGDTCAPCPCIPLSLGSCPEHLCPSHPQDGDHAPGPALRQAINIPPNLPSSLKPLALLQWSQPLWINRAPPASPSQQDARRCSKPRGRWDIPAALPEAPQISGSVLQLILSHPLQLHLTYKNSRQLGRTRRIYI